jgi:hypothetical protein
MPIGRIPGILSIAMSLPVLKALMVGQGINSLAIRVARRAKQDLSLLLDVPWAHSQDLRAAASTPPRPGPPCRFPATLRMISSVMVIPSRSGVSPKSSKSIDGGGLWSGCFSFRTCSTVRFPIMSLGSRRLPFSVLHANFDAAFSSPLMTLSWKILCLCSVVRPPCAVFRLAIQSLSQAWTSILYFLSFQSRILRRIVFLMSPFFVTPLVLVRITVMKSSILSLSILSLSSRSCSWERVSRKALAGFPVGRT